VGGEFQPANCKVMHVGIYSLAYKYFKSTRGGEGLWRGSVLGQLGRNFHYRDRDTFLRLCKQYVRPHLESSWFQGDKDTLERVLGKVVKIVAGLKGADCLEKCAELCLETLQKRRENGLRYD
jgi:hypothetical protein